jgi:ABC-type bacteriocin/lantibiotic exporter with double-glycine peptidase domain
LPDGKELSSSNAQKILLARSIINKPKMLLLEDALDKMDEIDANEVIDFIMDPSNNWTVIVTSKNKHWKQKSSRVIAIDKGIIISDK